MAHFLFAAGAPMVNTLEQRTIAGAAAIVLLASAVIIILTAWGVPCEMDEDAD